MDILTFLYLGTGAYAALSFIPQIGKLLFHPEARKGISPTAWLGFTMASAVGLAYALLRAHDGPMALTAAIYLTGNASVLCLSFLPKHVKLKAVSFAPVPLPAVKPPV